MSSTAWDASDAWWHADGSEWWYEGWGDQSATEYRTDWDAGQAWQEPTGASGQTGAVGSLIISPCLAESSEGFGSSTFQFVEEDGEVEGRCHEIDADVPLEHLESHRELRLRGLADADCRVLSLVTAVVTLVQPA